MDSTDRTAGRHGWHEFLGSTERTLLRADGAECAGLRVAQLPSGIDVAVLGDPALCEAHAGNLLAALGRRGCGIHRMEASGRLDQGIRPELVVAAASDAQALTVARELSSRDGRPTGLLGFPTADERVTHLAVAGSRSDSEAVERALGAHASQLARTDYVGVLRAAMIAAAARARLAGLLTPVAAPAADVFSVATMDAAGRCSAAPDDARRELVAPGAAPSSGREALEAGPGHHVLAISPHPDDVEIAAGLFVRAALRAGATVHNVLHSAGHRGVSPEYPCAESLMGTGERGNRAVRQLAAALGVPEAEVRQDPEWLAGAVRLAETLAAAKALATGIPVGESGGAGIVVTQIAADRNAPPPQQRVHDGYAEVLERHLATAAGAPWTVVLPHPEDAHPTHRATTERALTVLAGLAARARSIRLVFYRAAWSGTANTYFLGPADTAAEALGPRSDAAVAVKHEKCALAILVGELAAARFGLASPSPEAMGGAFAESFERSLIS